MNYEDIRSSIRNGDILGYHGTAIFSKLIELFTGKKDAQAWSHIAVFYWDGPGLWLAQEYEGVGFGCYPASQLIAKFIKERGQCFLGRAPEMVENNPDGIRNVLSTYRTTPKLRPYGYGSLAKILFDDREDPDKAQAVCSIFAQQAWEACGYKFMRLFAPEDFKTVVTETIAIT